MRKHIAAMLGLTLLMFIALPSAAQQNASISNFSGVTLTDINLWGFTWDTVPGTQSIDFQVKGGGISDVWVSQVSFLSPFEDGDKTTYLIVGLNYQQEIPLYFRVRVTHSAGTTDWAQLQWGTDS